jgi:hypothetical protein
LIRDALGAKTIVMGFLNRLRGHCF